MGSLEDSLAKQLQAARARRSAEGPKTPATNTSYHTPAPLSGSQPSVPSSVKKPEPVPTSIPRVMPTSTPARPPQPYMVIPPQPPRVPERRPSTVGRIWKRALLAAGILAGGYGLGTMKKGEKAEAAPTTPTQTAPAKVINNYTITSETPSAPNPDLELIKQKLAELTAADKAREVEKEVKPVEELTKKAPENMVEESKTTVRRSKSAPRAERAPRPPARSGKITIDNPPTKQPRGYIKTWDLPGAGQEPSTTRDR